MLGAIEILLSDARGVYIPQDFIADCGDTWEGIDPTDAACCEAGPDGEWYWEAWQNILDSAHITFGDDTYRLHQDGDVFAVCDELMTDEERANFFGDDC